MSIPVQLASIQDVTIVTQQVMKWNKTCMKPKFNQNPHTYEEMHIFKHLLTHILCIYNISQFIYIMTSTADHKWYPQTHLKVSMPDILI